ncbi:MAG TPA: ATP-binding protein [Polyangiaceae bacterium]|nr:ATP-binding protein [Polyangiaceae bacterium]
MSGTVKLDGKRYDQGSAEHLEKIDSLHRAEISKQTEAYVHDINQLQEAEDRSRLINEELTDGVREHTAALAVANEATQQSEDRFRLLVNGVRDYALMMLDPQGVVVSWNAGAEHIKGYSAREIVGRHFSVFYEPAAVVAGQPETDLDTALRTGRAEEEGFRVRKDGSRFWASVVLSPILDPAGQLLGFAKISRDLTERRNLENQLHQAQKMEAIGSLAAGVAHDFNNLLCIILSYSELLEGDLKRDDPMRSDVQEIKAAGLLAVTLTRQLLAFSRQQVLQPQIVDLSAVVQGLEKMLRRLIGEEIELATACAPLLGAVLVDPGQMEQVIINLVVNARDAMPDGGKISIETREVELNQDYANDHVGVTAGPHILLTVTDTGMGMDSATQSRMFEPFFTTKEMGKGSGLGLATVFGIVRQSGGTIWVSSELGKGTRLEVYLPMADRAAVVRVSVEPPHNRSLRGDETILLVEDDERVRLLARNILRRYGYNVLDARGGGDALLLCEQYSSPIHVLLTDVVMPRMSGRKLAERLLQVRPDMKVIYMSGYTDDAVVRHGVFHSTLAFVEKPFTPEALARKVRQCLDS